MNKNHFNDLFAIVLAYLGQILLYGQFPDFAARKRAWEASHDLSFSRIEKR